jgi:uncharacterized membrane protein
MMRIETAFAWILASICVMIIGLGLLVFGGLENGRFAGFLIGMGIVDFGIGAVLTIIHDHHMAKRTRPGRE